MLAPQRMQRLISGIPADQVARLMQAFSEGSSTEERVGVMEDVLRTAGQAWRDEIGAWVAEMLSVERLVPDALSQWRPLVRDSMAFVAAHISDHRLAAKIVQQVELPPDTRPEARLGAIIAKTPGLQKLGQVLARARRLTPALRTELQKLENGIADSSIEEVREIISGQLGPALRAYKVRLAPRLLSEASVSATVQFTWWNPATGKRERGVFKVMKPHVPECYAEDLSILQQLAEHLATKGSDYYFASREVTETLDEVRMLLEKEVDFRLEQATLAEVGRVYQRRHSVSPTPVPELSTDTITAMSFEAGVKVTEAFRQDPAARRQIASQIIETLIADPIFSEEKEAVFHADPHAGNLFYDERHRKLVVLDWALTGRLTLSERRHVARLIMSMTFRDMTGVKEEIQALSREASGPDKRYAAIIDRAVEKFFAELPFVCSPGAIHAMQLLDDIGVQGVRFPGSLVLIRKVLFTLDGVLNDISGGQVRMDTVIARDFAVRLMKRPGALPPPFRWADVFAAQRSALLYATGLWSWFAEAPLPDASR